MACRLLSCRCRLALILAVVFLAAPRLCAVVAFESAAVTQARDDLEAGRYAEAHERLQQAFREAPANADISFLMGQAAMGLEDYEGAAAAFDRVLAIHPDADRARLELARAYAHLGLYSVAEELFREVDRQPETPAGVRRNIRAHLEQIATARSRHAFSGVLTVAFARDNNARISPDGTIALPGLPPLSVPVERDLYAAQSLFLQHHLALVPARLAWATEMLAYNALYRDEGDLDVQYLRLDTGPRWQRGRAVLGLGLNGGWMVKDDDRYLGTWGGRAYAEVALTRTAAVRIDLSGERRRYWQDREADGTAAGVALRPSWARGRHAVSAEVGLEMHRAREGWETYDKAFVGLGYQMALPWRLTLLTGCGWEYWRFDDSEPLAVRRRRDDIGNLSLGLRRRLGRHASAEVRHRFETSDSTSDLYDYQRQVTVLSLTCAF